MTCVVCLSLRFLFEGMLHGLIGVCCDVICCRLKLGAYRPREVSLRRAVYCLYSIQKYRLLACVRVLPHCDVDLIYCAEFIPGCAATQPDEQSKQSPDSAVSWPWPSGVAPSQWPVFGPPSNCWFCLLGVKSCYLMLHTLWFSILPMFDMSYCPLEKDKTVSMCCTPTVSIKCSSFSFQLH